MILHNIVRATEDVDILIARNEANYARVISALSQLKDRAAAELTPQDFEENVVIKIADEVEVDVSVSAWTVTYDEAVTRAQAVEVEGVRIPYLALPDLIRSKSTWREQDRADLERLRRLL